MRFGKLMCFIGAMFQGKDDEPFQPSDFFESIKPVEVDLQAAAFRKMESIRQPKKSG